MGWRRRCAKIENGLDLGTACAVESGAESGKCTKKSAVGVTLDGIKGADHGKALVPPSPLAHNRTNVEHKEGILGRLLIIVGNDYVLYEVHYPTLGILALLTTFLPITSCLRKAFKRRYSARLECAIELERQLIICSVGAMIDNSKGKGASKGYMMGEVNSLFSMAIRRAQTGLYIWDFD